MDGNADATLAKLPDELTEPENFLVSDRAHTSLPEPEMIFPEIWPERTVGLFTGDGATGKTHFTLQLLMAIASGGEIPGTPFHATTARPVVFITQEDECNFILRELFHQYPSLRDNDALGKQIRIISTALQGRNLFLGQDSSYRYMVKNLPEGGVFVLDSWSTFLTSNENDNTELLRNEITSLRMLMKARKATPLLLHHRPKVNAQTGIQSTFRGGTALPNICRFHILLERKSMGSRLSFEKASRAGKIEPIDLIFDEDRRLFVSKELDPYVAAFEVGEILTTSRFLEKLGKDPRDEKERRRALDKLRHRSKPGGPLAKVAHGKKGEDGQWRRVAQSASEEIDT